MGVRTSGTSKTGASRFPYGPLMDLRLSVIGLVVSDMAATLAFYRRLGLDLPDDADARPHVEVEVGGLRLAFDKIGRAHV